MTRAPVVTVLLPTFNRARLLPQAIASVLGQSFVDLELIVVDDGSSDDTAAVVEAIADPRLRYLRRPHAGISAAMNAGLAAARGEFVGRVDSDDLWLPDLLAVQVAALREHPRAGAATARSQAMDAGGVPLPSLWGGPPRFPGDTFRSMVYEDFTSNITVVARRSCVEEAGGYDESMPTNEDWDLWLRVASRHELLYLDRVLARFRWHGDNVTGPGSPHFVATIDGRVHVLDKLFATPALPPRIARMKGVAYRNVHLGAGLRWLNTRHPRRAAGAFARALGAGANPATTAVLIAWSAFRWEVLNRLESGRRFAAAVASLRRRWAERRTPEPGSRR